MIATLKTIVVSYLRNGHKAIWCFDSQENFDEKSSKYFNFGAIYVRHIQRVGYPLNQS